MEEQNEREEKGYRKSKTCKVGRGTASYPQLVKGKNRQAFQKKKKTPTNKNLLEFSLTARTKLKAWLQLKTSECFGYFTAQI